MDSEKSLDIIQKDHHLIYSFITDDIRFAKVQIWRIAFYAISLMAGISALRSYGNLKVCSQYHCCILIVFNLLVVFLGVRLLCIFKRKKQKKDQTCRQELWLFIKDEKKPVIIISLAVVVILAIVYFTTIGQPDNLLLCDQQREDTVFDLITYTIAVSTIFLLTIIQADIIYRYRPILTGILNRQPKISEIIGETGYRWSWLRDLEYWLIISLSIFVSAILLALFSFK